MKSCYGQFCPVSKAAEILGERWTILIVRELVMGTTRFNDFQSSLSQISPTLLTRRLNQLEECGLVTRKCVPGQRRVEYHPTAAGKELKAVIMSLGKWGMRWARGQMNEDELDVELLVSDLLRRVDRTQLPGGRTVIKFQFRGLPKFEHWWMVLDEDGSRELCVKNPGKRVDVELITDLRTMTYFWAGDLNLHAIKRDKLQLKGDPMLVRTVSAWLRPSSLAHIRPHPLAPPEEKSNRKQERVNQSVVARDANRD